MRFLAVVISMLPLVMKNPYYNSEDNVVTEMIGKNHFVRYYDTMSSLHQAHLVVYDVNKDFEKKIINLTPYLKKIKNFKDIKRSWCVFKNDRWL